MTSIHTNASAIAALATLRSINKQLDETQERLATGLRINEAADNPAYWSIATTMRGDIKMLSAVQDSLEMGAAIVDTAYLGMDAAISVMDEFKAKLVMASEPGVDKTKIDKELTELKEQLRSIVSASSFNGQNWLVSGTAAGADKTVVAGFTRAANGAVYVQKITYGADSVPGPTNLASLIDYGSGGANGILTSSAYATAVGASTSYAVLKQDPSATTTEISLTSTTTAAQLDEMISTVDAMMKQMTDVGASLGATKSRIENQLEFQKKLQATLEKGVGRLVDADMEEESTRLKALQAQQQLAIQALQIANNEPNLILELFR
ncbi:flagellin [Rhizobium sp. RU36D]|uniref:flagellin N-terminal helical domain-containing protein n=1 Tax=Rhizobium sp. RU36D TaxID=1907415 RepID=UPI0009D7B36F|nr:flagellin [Rhizobium sp. RU36D]SMD07683.1 flagellin [Rhizobium sp. RU36D]